MRRGLAFVVLLATVACGRTEPKVTTIAVAGRPADVTVAAGRVWVADDGQHAVEVIDTKTNRVIGAPIAMKQNPIAVTGDDRAVWVAHASGWIVRIDAHTLRTRFAHIGGSLTGITTLDGRVWVTDIEHSRIDEIDGSTLRVLRKVKVADGAVRVLGARHRLWVTGTDDAVTEVRELARRTMRVGGGPIGLADDGSKVWVANSDDGTVSSPGGPVYESGRGPIGLAFTDDAIWVANQEDKTLSRLDRKTGKQQGPVIELPGEPRGIVEADGSLWVACVNPEGVVRVDP